LGWPLRRGRRGVGDTHPDQCVWNLSSRGARVVAFAGCTQHRRDPNGIRDARPGRLVTGAAPCHRRVAEYQPGGKTRSLVTRALAKAVIWRLSIAEWRDAGVENLAPPEIIEQAAQPLRPCDEFPGAHCGPGGCSAVLRRNSG